MIPFIGIVLIIFIVYGLYSGLETTYYTYQDVIVPKEFDGFKIVFISDFHCKEFGSHEDKLIQSIEECEPDIIVFTGDMIDSDHGDLTPVEDLLSALSGRYPMYAVSGNHELDNLSLYRELLECYDEYGVNFLDGKLDLIDRDGSTMGIYGKQYAGDYLTESFLKKTDMALAEFNILLYHDSTVFPAISTLGFNMVLSGHTHGGIIRLPLIGGLINNNRTMIASYEKGLYKINNSTLISSRGLGDAKIPRFYNRSEIICITLRSENAQ